MKKIFLLLPLLLTCFFAFSQVKKKKVVQTFDQITIKDSFKLGTGANSAWYQWPLATGGGGGGSFSKDTFVFADLFYVKKRTSFANFDSIILKKRLQNLFLASAATGTGSDSSKPVFRSITVADLPDAYWYKTGNSAIDASHYFGTNNNASLRFRTNNIERAILDSIGRFWLKGFADNSVFSGLLNIANNAGRSVLDISTNSSSTVLQLNTNNSIMIETMRFVSGYRDSISGVTQFPIFMVAGGGLSVDANSGLASDALLVTNRISSNTPLLTVHGANFRKGVVIGDTTVYNGATSAFDVNSTDKGVLLPRLNTTAMNAIAAPPNGLIIYNTDSAKFCFYNGSVWAAIGTGSGGGSSIVKQADTTAVTISNTTTWFIVNPAVVISSLTLTMPPAPADGQTIHFSFGGTITASGSAVINTFTLTPNTGQTFTGGNVFYALEPEDVLKFRYNSTNSKWYRQ